VVVVEVGVDVFKGVVLVVVVLFFVGWLWVYVVVVSVVLGYVMLFFLCGCGGKGVVILFGVLFVFVW